MLCWIKFTKCHMCLKVDFFQKAWNLCFQNPPYHLSWNSKLTLQYNTLKQFPEYFNRRRSSFLIQLYQSICEFLWFYWQCLAMFDSVETEQQMLHMFKNFKKYNLCVRLLMLLLLSITNYSSSTLSVSLQSFVKMLKYLNLLMFFMFTFLWINPTCLLRK